MNTITQNILNITDRIICHQVNCQGVMGTGIALDIKKKYPIVYKEYMRFCNSVDNNEKLLGEVLFVSINNNLTVGNLFAQFDYGRDKRYTDYDMLKKCLHMLGSYSNLCNIKPIHFPYKIGCNNAGGDWGIVSKLIEEYLPESIICKKN